MSLTAIINSIRRHIPFHSNPSSIVKPTKDEIEKFREPTSFTGKPEIVQPSDMAFFGLVDPNGNLIPSYDGFPAPGGTYNGIPIFDGEYIRNFGLEGALELDTMQGSTFINLIRKGLESDREGSPLEKVALILPIALIGGTAMYLSSSTADAQITGGDGFSPIVRDAGEAVFLLDLGADKKFGIQSSLMGSYVFDQGTRGGLIQNALIFGSVNSSERLVMRDTEMRNKIWQAKQIELGPEYSAEYINISAGFGPVFEFGDVVRENSSGGASVSVYKKKMSLAVYVAASVLKEKREILEESSAGVNIKHVDEWKPLPLIGGGLLTLYYREDKPAETNLGITYNPRDGVRIAALTDMYTTRTLRLGGGFEVGNVQQGFLGYGVYKPVKNFEVAVIGKAINPEINVKASYIPWANPW